ncbi:hypothetical protein DSECCO2_431480 [anaerobic digester metagenome]
MILWCPVTECQKRAVLAVNRSKWLKAITTLMPLAFLKSICFKSSVVIRVSSLSLGILRSR